MQQQKHLIAQLCFFNKYNYDPFNVASGSCEGGNQDLCVYDTASHKQGSHQAKRKWIKASNDQRGQRTNKESSVGWRRECSKLTFIYIFKASTVPMLAWVQTITWTLQTKERKTLKNQSWTLDFGLQGGAESDLETTEAGGGAGRPPVQQVWLQKMLKYTRFFRRLNVSQVLIKYGDFYADDDGERDPNESGLHSSFTTRSSCIWMCFNLSTSCYIWHMSVTSGYSESHLCPSVWFYLISDLCPSLNGS